MDLGLGATSFFFSVQHRSCHVETSALTSRDSGTVFMFCVSLLMLNVCQEIGIIRDQRLFYF